MKVKKLTLERANKIMEENGGNLDLRDTPIEELPDGLMVRGNLCLYNTKIKRLPKKLKVGGNLDLRHTPIKSLPAGLSVGGSLDLSFSTIEELPSDLVVGGWIDLNFSSIKELPANLVVGEDIFLQNTAIKVLPDSLKIGGNIMGNKYLTVHQLQAVNELKQGEYAERRYIFADGILTHVSGVKKVGKYTYYIGKIKGKNVLSDGANYVHCKSVKDGIQDLAFKVAKDRGANQYSELTLYSVVSAEDAITMYRIITGACKQGTEQFVNSLGELKPSYTVSEIINLTQGQYGADVFKNFFK